MHTLTRRSAVAAFAASVLAPIVALAQGATNAPRGGVPSTTAPSNSEGTPAGGTGVLGGARPTGPASAPATSSSPLIGGAAGTSETTSMPPRRHRHRHRHHHTSSSSTSQ